MQQYALVQTKITHPRRQDSDRHWSKSKMVFAKVYNLDQRIAQLNEKTVFFDTDTEFVVCDNSANTHVCNNKSMFTELHPIENPTHVATIGGRNTLPSGIGQVKWSWSDDNGKKHEYTLKKVYYFPQSPVNILSITEFAQQLKDEEGTGIDTKAFYSRFY
jgi:hypothetical protein